MSQFRRGVKVESDNFSNQELRETLSDQNMNAKKINQIYPIEEKEMLNVVNADEEKNYETPQKSDKTINNVISTNDKQNNEENYNNISEFRNVEN